MKEYIKNKWIIITCIWCCILFLTYWNVKNIDEVANLKQAYALLIKKNTFVQENSEKIQETIKDKGSSHQLIESLQLGYLSVENYLRKLSGRFHLNTIRTEFDMNVSNQFSRGKVPINIFFGGDLTNSIEYLNRLEKDKPYIKVKSVTALFDRDLKQTDFEVVLIYRYHITSQEKTT